MGEQPGYLAYMLRMWRVDTGRGHVWHASLESPHTGERVGFGSLEALFAFLTEKTEGTPLSSEDKRRIER